MNKKKIGIFIAILMLLMSGCFISQKEKTVQIFPDKSGYSCIIFLGYFS